MIAKPFRSLIVAFVAFCAMASFTNLVHGHFIWVAKSKETGKVNIYFGEGPSPDQKQFLAGIKDMKVFSFADDGSVKEISTSMKSEGSDGWFETAAGLSVVDVDCEYGVFGRGDKSMFLHYCAKFVSLQSGANSKSTSRLPFDIALENTGTKPTLAVTFHNKPASKCELLVLDHDDENHEFETDENGKVELPIAIEGRFQIRAKMVQEEAGKHKGQEYSEKRFYCTLIIDGKSSGPNKTEVVLPAAENTKAKLSCATPFPGMPVGVTSFGGAVASGHLYFYGGHCGNAHEYYDSGQNGQLYRLNIENASTSKWESVCESGGLQGLAMVEHDGDLYRVGGFKAHNAKGEKHNLHSVAEFAKFDFDTKTWKNLSPMPVPRSSLDAVVVNDTLFVVGGWTMKGENETKWCSDALSIDLSKENANWNTIKVPFQRRALSVGFQGDQLYAVGGMRKKGGPTSEVMVYNIANQTWSSGPELPGASRMEGFGSSCFNVGGRLVVSTYGGEVLQLNDDQSGWEKLYQLETSRFFHRLLPLANDKFMLVGGANMEVGKIFDVEVLSFN